MADRPNILLITTDTQRWDTLQCMGSAFAHSPHLDRLAAEGVLFENAHTPSPVCMPARCSLMTGTHAHVHGVIENGFQRHSHLPMLPDLLKAQGYTNIMVGKTHFGPVPDSFDVQHVSWGEKNRECDDFYGEYIKAHGFTRARKHLRPNPVPEDLCLDAHIADIAIMEMEQAAAGTTPFFTFCSFVSPHGPIDPPGRWADLYNRSDLPVLNYREGEIQEHPPALRRLLGYPDKPKQTLDEIMELRRQYYGLAAYVDHQVGRLLHFLDRTGLHEKTLVVFTSDHGQQHFDHGFSNKHNWYDETWRVPLILSHPGTLPAGARAGFASWTDLTVSILAAAGTACPTMQGYDLVTPLRREAPSPRAGVAAVCQRSLAVASERWKLEYYFDDADGRLFDRQKDPQEQQDLFADANHREVRDGLLRGLLAWYGDAADLHGLVTRSEGGGPIAQRAVAQMTEHRGVDAEERLGRVCRWADAHS